VADTADLMALQYLNQLPDQRRLEFQMAFQAQKKDRTTALLLSLFLGYVGADRFYLGQTGLGIFKLLTFGGCGFWGIIDWFLIMGAADQRNIAELQKLQMMYGALSPQPSYPQLPYQGGYGPPSGGGYGPPPSGGGYGPPPR
jgi:TM2 domain-containing membrane protein YozV